MTTPVRALLLSAGLGTRLRPITLETPKCLVKVAGAPLLARWLRQLESIGCEAVLINTHYLADKVIKFLENWRSPNMQIVTTYEPQLLGTAGTLLANPSCVDGATGLLIHADTAMEGNLCEILSAHKLRSVQCLLTMLTFQTDRPRTCGIVLTDSNGVVTEFHEKVDHPPGNCANGALYVFESSLIESLLRMSPSPSDFSTEVIPNLLGRIQTWHTDQPYLDIGTPESLADAQSLLSPIS